MIEQLITTLNTTDESITIEAKTATEINKSVMETVCSFSNEPNQGGGYIVLGLHEKESSNDSERYEVCGVAHPDKLQLDLSTRCATDFNIPVRPEITIERVNDKNVMIVYVPEVPAAQKPVYFKKLGLPRGAYRRIGSSDQQSTDEDMHVFYHTEDTFDSGIVCDSSISDISDDALRLYRHLRSQVNPSAEELQYDDIDLLQSLGCIRKQDGEWVLTYTGLVVFGTRAALRRLLPMMRVDYIRVPGNEWIEDPDNRFTSVDMRGSLLEMVQRVFNLIYDDLPKGFLLQDGELQAGSVGLPAKVLREAIVNSHIHMSLRVHQPIQIIRYGNRIEITNPGFSLKSEDSFGTPGSVNRNPTIASIFHETNLAETKGSGIRTMRALMDKARMMPPTFESDHKANTFTIRLLLHHFLREEDIAWLAEFDVFHLNDAQKRGLIFLREVGAIDNKSYRQLNGMDALIAGAELKYLRDSHIIIQKGTGKGSYYIAGEGFVKTISLNEPVRRETNQLGEITNHLSPLTNQFDEITNHLSPLTNQFDEITNHLSPLTNRFDEITNHLSPLTNRFDEMIEQIPDEIKSMLNRLHKRNNRQEMETILLSLCSWRELTLEEIAAILKKKDEKHLLYNYITPLRKQGKLQYTIPDMPNHPKQAYRACADANR